MSHSCSRRWLVRFRMNRLLSSGARGIRAAVPAVPRLSQPARNYWVSVGDSGSVTGGSFWKLMSLTGVHGAEFYVLSFMLTLAGSLCLFHITIGSWWKKPEVAWVMHCPPDTWTRRHDLGFNWNGSCAQRYFSEAGLGCYTPTGDKSLAYTDQAWTAELKQLLHEIHDK